MQQYLSSPVITIGQDNFKTCCSVSTYCFRSRKAFRLSLTKAFTRRLIKQNPHWWTFREAGLCPETSLGIYTLQGREPRCMSLSLTCSAIDLVSLSLQQYNLKWRFTEHLSHPFPSTSFQNSGDQHNLVGIMKYALYFSLAEQTQSQHSAWDHHVLYWESWQSQFSFSDHQLF